MKSYREFTTRELVEEFENVEIQILLSCGNEEKLTELAKLKNDLVVILSKKTEKIDDFILFLDSEVEAFLARKAVLDKEMKRITAHIKRRKKTKETLNDEIIPVIIDTIGHEGKLKTQTTTYTKYEAWASAEYDEEKIPEEYKSVKYVPSVNVAKLRKDTIAAQKEGKTVKGCSVPMVYRIRRS